MFSLSLFVLLTIVTLTCEASETTNNLLIKAGFNTVTGSKLISHRTALKGKVVPKDLRAANDRCDRDIREKKLRFLVLEHPSKLPGVIMQYYAGLCEVNINHTFRFYDGQIFELNVSDHDSETIVGSYDATMNEDGSMMIKADNHNISGDFDIHTVEQVTINH